MAEVLLSENPSLQRELSEIPKRKLPLKMDIDGQTVDARVEYGIEVEKIVGTCGECKKEGKSLFRERVSGEVQVTTTNVATVAKIQEGVRALVTGVENEMLCCESCFTDEFIQKRPGKYIEAMQTVSEKLGIKIDIEGLKEAISKA